MHGVHLPCRGEHHVQRSRRREMFASLVIDACFACAVTEPHGRLGTKKSTT